MKTNIFELLLPKTYFRKFPVPFGVPVINISDVQIKKLRHS